MKYIKTFESHRDWKKSTIAEPVNEEIFGAIGRLLGNLFKKVKERIIKTKGGKEVEAIYQKYLGMIDKELSKTAKVELNLAAAARQSENPEATPPKVEESKTHAGLSNFSNISLINEAEVEAPVTEDEPEVDAKTAVDQLKSKKTILDQIVKKLKDMAIKEMDLVLKKYGGGAKNPQLEIIINAKKDQFELDYLNAQITYLEKSGDKTASLPIAKQRDAVIKKIENDYKEFDTKKPVEYKEGNSVVYILKDKKPEFDKLTTEEKKKPLEGKAKALVAVGEIIKIDGDKFKIETESGEEIEKSGSEIVSMSESVAVEFKVGDTVIFKRDTFKDNDGKKKWSELKDDEKTDPKSDKIKALKKEGLINVVKVDKIEGDLFIFKVKGQEFKKKRSEVLSVAQTKK